MPFCAAGSLSHRCSTRFIGVKMATTKSELASLARSDMSETWVTLEASQAAISHCYGGVTILKITFNVPGNLVRPRLQCKAASISTFTLDGKRKHQCCCGRRANEAGRDVLELGRDVGTKQSCIVTKDHMPLMEHETEMDNQPKMVTR